MLTYMPHNAHVCARGQTHTTHGSTGCAEEEVGAEVQEVGAEAEDERQVREVAWPKFSKMSTLQ